MTTFRDQPMPPGSAVAATIERLVVVEAVPVRGDGVAAALAATGRYHVTIHHRPVEAMASARWAAADPPRLAVIDLWYPETAVDGVDVAEAFARWCPETALVLRGGEPGPSCDRLAANWRRLQPLSLLLKSRPLSEQVAILDELVRIGLPYRDPAWRLGRPVQDEPGP
ncbi:MAG: hypothetical protein R2761_30020 [Acidimicrobiales bacterium]